MKEDFWSNVHEKPQTLPQNDEENCGKFTFNQFPLKPHAHQDTTFKEFYVNITFEILELWFFKPEPTNSNNF
ncbi:CLUMA_CG008544, isoform A [Clunio marinus]|uniref:CLUMA_CG008544, isoform A n=1 Tax=Clunio marinus TaxID=568069 RepID=A0A1J1I5P5_9DIPT|nr:CLUMA_CG008544, isoform A [Clunio marinus]